LKRWHVDRVTVLLFIAVVSFLYDLSFYLGIRDTTRFPHPFVYFRSLGDIEYLRGFPGMLRQAMFSIVAGGLVGWAVSLLIQRNGWLTQTTIRFLRVVMWFPFLVAFAAPNPFIQGIAVAMLAMLYYYLTAQSFLGLLPRDAFRYAAGEVILQTLFFSLLSQIWIRGWDWAIFPMKSDVTTGFAVLALLLILVLLINWIFGRNFPVGCTRRAILREKELFFSKHGSFLGVTLLTSIWLLLWHLTGVALLYDPAALPFPAIQRVGELLISQEAWHDILISMAEIGVGLFLSGLLALTVSTLLRRSEGIQYSIAKILPATFLTPMALWLLVFHFVLSPSSNMNWYRSFFLGVGHKMMGVGLLTFFPLVHALWAFRDAPLLRRWLIAIDDALPIAFVAMIFGELYAATAGLGFQMVIASATYQYRQGLGYFLITAILLAALSMILRTIVGSAGLRIHELEAH